MDKGEKMDIELLETRIEELSTEVHNAWWEGKKKQGFHPPLLCENYKGAKFVKCCPKCHTDMYLYKELPEYIKEYDRATVRTVLNAINTLTSHAADPKSG